MSWFWPFQSTKTKESGTDSPQPPLAQHATSAAKTTEYPLPTAFVPSEAQIARARRMVEDKFGPGKQTNRSDNNTFQ